ncbi:hypothetical protein [Actinokineospora cianjurensis]|uniref:Uncharacterized protein n=1 Tax=Actinokineospora cianjurensis TaxID=585224 RepID=A0A421AYI5_9PSEU|nr:hypothetical protein [Actinokineospora cianjurensis]RLK54880.1 hypothetical protein CLV68_5271 [Actinokineospora cianjurensis]
MTVRTLASTRPSCGKSDRSPEQRPDRVVVDGAGAEVRADVVDALHGYETYKALHGAVLQVELTAQQREWVGAHWAAHR